VSDFGWRKPSFLPLVIIIELKYFILIYTRNKNYFELALDKQRNDILVIGLFGFNNFLY